MTFSIHVGYKFMAVLFFSVRIIQVKLSISCENMSGYQYRSCIHQTLYHREYIQRKSYNLNDIPVLCCYVFCVVICTDWLCSGCIVGNCTRIELNACLL
jgi:hypothetical protein